VVSGLSEGSHIKLKHDEKPGFIIFPDHGSQEVGKGLKDRILKDAGIKKEGGRS
jgi:mRNA interferase HicA